MTTVYEHLKSRSCYPTTDLIIDKYEYLYRLIEKPYIFFYAF